MSLLSQFYPSGSGSLVSNPAGLIEGMSGYPTIIPYKCTMAMSVAPYNANAPGTDYTNKRSGGQIHPGVAAQSALNKTDDVFTGMGEIVVGAVAFDTDACLYFRNWPASQAIQATGTTRVHGCFMSGTYALLRIPGVVSLEGSYITSQTTIISGVNFGQYATTLEDTTTSYIVPFGLSNPANSPAVLQIKNTSLNAASVNKILIDCADMPWSQTSHSPSNGGSIDLSGGSAAGSAALTTDGAAALSYLQGKGFSVILN